MVSGRNGHDWMSSWWVELIFLLVAIGFVWEAIGSNLPWSVLAWPGTLLAVPVWYLVCRLLRVRRGPWWVTIFPLLVFAACSTLVLFTLALRNDDYLRPAVVSLLWPLLLGLDSLLRFLPKRVDGQEPAAG